MEKKIEHLVQWLQQKVKEANVQGLIVGISGGIDSAVVAHLIKRACPNDSLGVIMPTKSNPQDKVDALKVVDSCGINHVVVELTETHNTLFRAIEEQLQAKDEWKEERSTLGDANTRARLRMTTLYAVANNYNYLVVGTDNAAEWLTGYFTKYGDGGVDLVPLVHLTKGEVREMAKALGVPDDVITKAPSAGLWEGQTDENEMGTTYDMIDKYLKDEEIPDKDREIIGRLHKRSEHKRQLAAAPPKFS
jgi:NAD+ synthase